MGFGGYLFLLTYFNSSMVRLEAAAVKSASNLNGFQFQYGAIGSVKASVTSTIELGFQFQYGAIGRIVPSSMV